MLVVSDERAVRIGGERGLAGAGKAEEDRRVAILAGIGRAMHRHDVLRRQDIVQIGEDRLLHLAGVARSADQDDPAGEVASDDRFAPDAVTLRVSLEGRHVEDGQVGNEGGDVLGRRANEQVADEQRVPGVFGEDARLDAEGRVCPAVEILREQGLALGVGEEVGEQDVEMLDRQGNVVVPPDDRIGVGVADDEFVLRASPGVDAGIGDKRPVLGDVRLVPLQGVLVKLRRAEVPVDARQSAEPEMVRPEVRVVCACFDHCRSLPDRRVQECDLASRYSAPGPKTIVGRRAATKDAHSRP